MTKRSERNEKEELEKKGEQRKWRQKTISREENEKEDMEEKED